MERIQETSDEIIVYDFNELRTRTDFPASLVRLAIRDVIRPIIDSKHRFQDIELGVGEIVKDVEVHGDELRPRLIIVQRELGGIAIDTINKIKENSESNGFGRMIIEHIFGDSYISEIDGDTFKGHLYIHADNSVRPTRQNHNAA